MELIAKVEALLFVTGVPLAPGKIAEITDSSPKEVREALNQLMKEYLAENRGIQVVEIAHGFQLATKPQLSAVVEKLFNEGSGASLSQAALETLSIIAYRQPATRVDLEAIRGVKVDGVLETLQKRRLIRVVGRKDAPGRPLLYSTTKEFLKYFGLKDLSELPDPRDKEIKTENNTHETLFEAE